MSDQQKPGFLAWFDSIQKIAAALGTVVVLIGGIIGLVYKLRQSPPPSQSAALEITDSFSAEFVDFLLDTGQKTSGYTSAQLDQIGNEYYVDVTLTGLRDKNAELSWNLRGDLSALPEDERGKWFHQFLTNVKPPVNEYTRVAKVWIQSPPFRGTFFAAIEIDYPKDKTLSVMKTKPFAGKKAQPREQAVSTTKTVTTIPATTTTAVTTSETTTTAVTTTETTTTAVTTLPDGTTTTSTVTIPKMSTLTVTTTTTATVPTTTPATTRTITLTTTTASEVPRVRPAARLSTAP